MNVIVLTGRLCESPELKTTQSGKPVLTIDIAVNRPFAKDTVDFFKLVLWQQNAEYVSRYAHKGSKVAVTGKLTTRKYQDKDGNNRTAFEIVADTVELLDSKNEATGTPTAQPTTYIPEAYTKPTQPKQMNFDEMKNDDDLPF